VSDIDRRIRQVEVSISINESLMTAALNPTAAGAVKDRLAALRTELEDLKMYRSGGAA
jgi:hypothetical protein